MGPEHTKRRKTLLTDIAGRKLDCLVVTHPANWFYLTGFTGESGALVVSMNGTTLLTDGRFTVQGKEETRGVKIELQQGGLYTALGAMLRRKGLRRVGYDANHLTVSQWDILRKAMGGKTRGFEASGLVQRLRMRYSDDEATVRSMRLAVLRAHNLIRDGVEHQALALMLWRAALPANVLLWERQG